MIYFRTNHSISQFLLAFIFCATILQIGANPECPQRLNNCTIMVRPYLNDIKYMFPTNIEDVDQMCRMWSQFVDCVRRYVSQCFSEERKLLFHKSVENSVDTVHAICSSEIYQKEYLSKAVCFKRISIDSCGKFYNQLIEHVSNPRAHDDHICCSYGQFKNCVNDPLLRQCGRRARGLMDHSMGFLISRCADLNVDSSSERCPDPIQSLTTTTTITPELEFNEENDISGKTRDDRSYEHEETSTTGQSDSWTPRPFVFTVAPQSGSQTSGDHQIREEIFIWLWAWIVLMLCKLY